MEKIRLNITQERWVTAGLLLFLVMYDYQLVYEEILTMSRKLFAVHLFFNAGTLTAIHAVKKKMIQHDLLVGLWFLFFGTVVCSLLVICWPFHRENVFFLLSLFVLLFQMSALVVELYERRMEILKAQNK